MLEYLKLDEEEDVHGPVKFRDNFPQFKYPKKIGTIYQKEIYQKGHKMERPEPFNVEKEHKIINPHKMELLTTNNVSFIFNN